MDVRSAVGSPAFAQQVLRGIATIEPPPRGESDLSLELGLSLWMRQTATDIDDAGRAMSAATHAQCDFAAVVERALGQMRSRKDHSFALPDRVDPR